ncbi:23S rRNA (uracil1939-C5)-methyltransferase [Rhodopseudomonas julia]|uniref:23S rRNA (Uracil1939-C5)-methyltransferase n=1 Tax=Rhodopseudomonas julia TaxID=200617 RepID=A0ABU0C2Q2_9BRAD|nr:RNA methyltransferase [Rhodopseudomonas julia]MDQ0324794.1 23S rRNA (uracil1939-C5)-methyltransferase [Rhodopseudomonas julia]
MSDIVDIDRIGHRGDGVAETPEGTLFVPYTLAGERVRVERRGRRAEVIEILEASPKRVAAPCPHFGPSLGAQDARCGGCALQMLPLEETRLLKHRFVAEALAKSGLETEVRPAFGAPLGARRRAVFSATLAGREIRLGFHERGSRRLVDLATCLVVRPAIVSALPLLRRLAQLLARPKRELRLTVLETRSGLDIAGEGAGSIQASAAARIAELLSGQAVARLVVDGDILFQLEEPQLEVGGVTVSPPPAAFVQACRESETAMARLVAEHCAGAKRVADLFSGLGTFSFVVGRTARVTAVEAEGVALAALAAAVRGAQGLKPIETLARDLLRFPLAPNELSRFDAVVLDPPWDGARAQAESLAASKVARIAFVSCNPASLARDLRILVDGGYRLNSVTPIDQFVYSAETEAVALLERE